MLDTHRNHLTWLEWFRFVLHCTVGRCSFWLGLSGAVFAAGDAFAKAPELPPTITFSELTAFDLAGVDSSSDDATLNALPTKVRSLSGTPVQIQGYMLPLSVESGEARQFLIMRSQNSCCFGQPMTVSEYLVATVKSGAGVPITMDVPLTYRGTLRIRPAVTDGKITELYFLENCESSIH